MGQRHISCHAKQRGDLCGSPDCRTCHPENFNEDGEYLKPCERCGEPTPEHDLDRDDVCQACLDAEEEEQEDAHGDQT